jgi:hypothetical protein
MVCAVLYRECGFAREEGDNCIATWYVAEAAKALSRVLQAMQQQHSAGAGVQACGQQQQQLEA